MTPGEAEAREALLARAHLELGEEVHRIGKKYGCSLGEMLVLTATQVNAFARLTVAFERRPKESAVEAKQEAPESLLVLPR